MGARRDHAVCGVWAIGIQPARRTRTFFCLENPRHTFRNNNTSFSRLILRRSTESSARYRPNCHVHGQLAEKWDAKDTRIKFARKNDEENLWNDSFHADVHQPWLGTACTVRTTSLLNEHVERVERSLIYIKGECVSSPTLLVFYQNIIFYDLRVAACAYTY